MTTITVPHGASPVGARSRGKKWQQQTLGKVARLSFTRNA